MSERVTAGRARRGLRAKELPALLLDGQSPRLLHALGLVRADGSANADSHRKIKQINHFLRLLGPGLEDVFGRHREPVLWDAAAGKAYLGLALYNLWCLPQNRGVLYAIERRHDLCDRMRDIAQGEGFDRFVAVPASIESADLPPRVHFALALHACDTATDAVILQAMRREADWIALVPCCQAEVARQLADLRTPGPVSPLWGEPLHRREMGAHLTNVLRALTLRAYGYQVTVTELAGWEHSLKNELILARRVGRFHAGARAALRTLLREIPVRPWLLRELGWFREPDTDADASGLNDTDDVASGAASKHDA